jgi:gamma-glutamyltranspeptidase/glutathione hydrolase
LNILAAYGITHIAPDTPSYIHTNVEAMKLGFADRHAYYGDPRFIDVPLQTLLSPVYAQARAAKIDSDKACSGMPAAGQIDEFDPGLKSSPSAANGGYHPPERDTSVICVVDKWGNCLAGAGHIVKKWQNYDWRAGAVCAIKRDEKIGRLEGGADPRRPTGIA